MQHAWRYSAPQTTSHFVVGQKEVIESSACEHVQIRGPFCLHPFFQYLLPVHPFLLLLDGKCFKTIQNQHTGPDQCTFSSFQLAIRPEGYGQSQKLGQKGQTGTRGTKIPKVLWKRSSIPKRIQIQWSHFLWRFKGLLSRAAFHASDQQLGQKMKG